MVPDFRILIIIGVMVLLAACSSSAGEEIAKATTSSIPDTEAAKATGTRQPPKPFCEEDLCDWQRNLTRTVAVSPDPVTPQPTTRFCEEDVCDNNTRAYQTMIARSAMTAQSPDRTLYLTPVLVVQPDIPADLQRRAADLFGGCGSTLTCESMPGGEALLAALGIKGSAPGLLVELPSGGVPGCSGLTTDLQQRRQFLESGGAAAAYLSFDSGDCDWIELARENGFSYGRAELDPLAELEQRLHPWRAGAGGWNQPDADGGLVVFPSGTPVNCKSELASSVSPNPACVLDQSDVDVAVWEAGQALAGLDGSGFSVYILPVSVAQEGDLLLLESLLKEMKAMAGEGQVQLLSLERAYELFLEQESAGD